jgi:hypothetical protein
MTDALLEMYTQPVTDKKRNDTFVKRKLARIENLTKQTQSSISRLQQTKEFA